MMNILSYKNYDSEELAKLSENLIKGIYNQVLTDGNVCIDVGAMEGEHSLGMADLVGPSGRVLSCESSQENLQFFRKNVRESALYSIIDIFDYAISKQENLDDMGLRSPHIPDGVPSGKGKAYPLCRVKIDSFLSEQNLSRLDFMKLSLGGAEFNALEDAFESIIKYQPIIVFKTPNEDAGQIFNYVLVDILTFMDKIDYAFYDIISGDRFSKKHWKNPVSCLTTVGIPQAKLSTNKSMLTSIHLISTLKKNTPLLLRPHLVFNSQKELLVAFAKEGESTVKEYDIEEFERLVGIDYVPHLVFNGETICEAIIKQCSTALKDNLLDEYCLWQGLVDSHLMKEHYLVDATIKWINEEIGYGLFTNIDIGEGDYIGEYTGVVQKEKTVSAYQYKYPAYHLENYGTYYIDSEDFGNEMRFMNHSCDPNIKGVDMFHGGILHVVFKATRSIPAGTQLCYDYGPFFWNSETGDPFKLE